MAGEWSKKAWGTMRRLIDSPVLRVEEIQIVRGGFCSVHLHAWQRNLFVVYEGELEIRYAEWEWVDGSVPLADMKPQHILRLGRPHVADANVEHQFLAFTFVRAVEIYVPAGHDLTCSAEDIVRREILGGVLT